MLSSRFNLKDLVAGLLFSGFGLAVALLAGKLPMGSGRSMGPGYFPYYIGVLLVITGVIVVIGSINSRESAAVGPLPVRAILSVIGGLVVFAATVDRLGFAVAIACVIGVSACAYKGSSVKETALSIALLVPAVYLIFGVMLGQPIRLLPMAGF